MRIMAVATRTEDIETEINLYTLLKNTFRWTSLENGKVNQAYNIEETKSKGKDMAVGGRDRVINWGIHHQVSASVSASTLPRREVC